MIIRTPSDAVPMLDYVANRKRENFGIILMNHNLEVIAKKIMFTGTVANCIVGIRELLVYALKKDACMCILFHNHPSGNCEPSEPDVNATKSFQEGCEAVGIRLQDHIIVSKDSYFSFKEHQMLKKSSKWEKSVAE